MRKRILNNQLLLKLEGKYVFMTSPENRQKYHHFFDNLLNCAHDMRGPRLIVILLVRFCNLWLACPFYWLTR